MVRKRSEWESLFHMRNNRQPGATPLNLEPNDLLLFARVVDEGSFSRAAQRLGMPKSTLSRRVAALENQLGERVLTRTTRKLTVTEFGTAVLQHARHVAEDVQAAESLAQNRQTQPSGRLRVTMPADLGNMLLAPWIAEFVLLYPAITLEIDFSARFVDLVGENFDVAIRMGELQDDASLAARRLATFRSSLYAAPGYVARRGAPAEPHELVQHAGLHSLSRTGEPIPWVLHRGDEQWRGVAVSRTVANSPEVLMRMALHGAGITLVHDHFALQYLERGELVPVLPEWRSAPISAWAVFPGRRLMPLRTRAFIDTLVARFSGPECAAVEASLQQSVRTPRGRPAKTKTRRG